MKYSIKKQFEESWKTKNYWDWYSLLIKRRIRFLKGKVLDIGCGTGELLQFYRNAIGIDMHNDAIRVCKQKGFKVLRMDAQNLKFKSNSFDSIHSNSVLDHLENPGKALKETHRVLKPNGILYMTLNDVSTRGEKWHEDPTHISPFTKKTIIEALEKARFKVERINWIPYKPPLAQILRFLPSLFVWICYAYGQIVKRQLEIIARPIK